MISLENDFAFLQAVTGDLESYLFSKELFWPVHVRNWKDIESPPPLTPGQLSLASTRLTAASRPDWFSDLEKLTAEINRFQARWQANWFKKAHLEAAVRVRLWESYLKMLPETRIQGAPEYPRQVRGRVILELISRMTGGLDYEINERVIAADGFLKNSGRPKGFIWESEIETGFPKEQYWYLYLGFSEKK